jgi:hypothetical protein
MVISQGIGKVERLIQSNTEQKKMLEGLRDTSHNIFTFALNQEGEFGTVLIIKIAL